MQVVALALKEVVLFDVQDNIQIAGWPAERARFAEATETDSRAVLHSRRHFGFDRAFAQQAPFAFALRAGIGDYTARALAGWAGSSDAEKALLIPDLASTVARLAGNRSFARRSARAATCVAVFMAANIDLFLGAKDGFLEFEMQVFTQVGAALGAAATAAALAKHIAKTEDVAKDVAEILEDGRIESSRTSSAAADASMSEAIIQRSLLAVGENGVRFGNLLELLFRVGIVRIAVGMMRHRELTVCALNLNVGSSTADAEYFVKIALCISGQKLPPV